jgi:8-oxo-dGTP diphosphatase
MIRIADEKINLKRGIDHIGVGAVSIIHDGKGKILLMKRGPKARDEHGRWDVCGGAIEFGETIEDAIVREVGEELCTVPLDMEFLTAYDAHREHRGSKTHWVQIIYAVKVDPKTVKIGEPHKISEIGWFDSKTLPSPLHSQFQKSLVPAKKAGIIN